MLSYNQENSGYQALRFQFLGHMSQFSQSLQLHKSVHISPNERHLHLPEEHLDFAHEQDVNSMMLTGAIGS